MITTTKAIIITIVLILAYIIYLNIDTIIEGLKVIAACMAIITLLKVINFFNVFNNQL